ncbi:MAG TPA: cyclic nucleotide-binding domain-containing protein [Candidatus Omnitrophota bacterium]|nr:cyclic nucleotide-binding domain-containing protein [Candidatus Omnitrophota bacterium]
MLALTDTCQASIYSRGRLCACLEPSALGRLRAAAGDQAVAPGSLVHADGEAAQSVFGLRQGVVMLFKQLPDRRRQVLSFLYPGDMFGLSDDGRHIATAVALTRVGLCRIPLTAAERDPNLARQLRSVAEASLADALDHALTLGRMTARERVGRFLAETWKRNCCPAELHLPMRIADIGDHLGLRAETVSRCLADLRRAGMIGPWQCDGFMAVIAPLELTRQFGG